MDPLTTYDDGASPQQMARDGRVARRRLRLLEQAARLAVQPAPELTWEAWSRQAARPEIEPTVIVDAAAARVAARHLTS